MKNSTGSVITIEPVNPGDQIGIAWISEADAPYVGFVYDEDKTPRGDVKGKIAAFSEAHAIKPFGDGAFCEHLDEPYTAIQYEEMDADEFLDRFGGLPKRSLCLFDEGGSIGSNKRAFGIDENRVLEANEASLREMRDAARNAGFAGFGLILAVVCLFLVICAISSAAAQTSYLFAASVLLFVLLVALGIGELIHLVPKVGRAMYKKIYR